MVLAGFRCASIAQFDPKKYFKEKKSLFVDLTDLFIHVLVA